jgi:hypothetical protein
MVEHELPKVIDQQQNKDVNVNPNDPSVRMAQDTWRPGQQNDFRDRRADTSYRCLQPLELRNDNDQVGDNDHRFNLRDKLEELRRRFEHTPSEQERTKAEQDLNSHISPLIPEADQKNLDAINHAILTGDATGLAQALKNVPPDKLDAYLKELNTNLDEAHAGVTLAKTEDGKVLLYRHHGHRALKVDPTQGTVLGENVIEEMPNGDVILGPEVLNADTGKLAKYIGDRATDNINGPDIANHPPIEWPQQPWPEFPQWPRWPKGRIWPEIPYGGSSDGLPPNIDRVPLYQYLNAINNEVIDLSPSPYVAFDNGAQTSYGTSV